MLVSKSSDSGSNPDGPAMKEKEKVKLIDLNLKLASKEASRYFFWKKCKLSLALFKLHVKNQLRDIWK